MFFRKRDEASRPADPATQLDALVREHLPEAGEELARILAAIAGLLASVAYADRHYAPDERARIAEELGRVDGLRREGVHAICALLDQHIARIATLNPQRYTRDLRDLAEPELRREVLQVLVDLAAADGEVSLQESTLLRRTTTALGLEQADYNEAQARHRHRLSVLK